MQNAIINVNGEILNPEKAKVSVFDRSYLYGDSLYEVVRSYRGQFFLIDEHLERLGKSAQLCQLDLGYPLSKLKQEMIRTFHAFRSQPGFENAEGYCRIVISRGEGKIGFGKNCLITPALYTIIVQQLEVPSEAQYQRGLKMRIVDRLRYDQRALDPAMKSGNYLNSLLGYLEATEQGFDDALLCNAEGHLTEGTTFNLFYVRRGMIATPPLDIGILHGITRHFVLGIAKHLGIGVREVRFPRERVYEADEVFLTSSIKEVMAITQVDRFKIGASGRSPQEGPITRKLREAFRQAVREKVS